MKRAAWLLSVLLVVAFWAQAQNRRPLGDVARDVRAARAGKDLTKVPKYTNDNLPRAGAISIMSARGAAQSGSSSGGAATTAAGGTAAEGDCDEQCWRDKFNDKRQAIAQAEKELDILQREHNLARTQFYRDPNRALSESTSNAAGGGTELQEIQKKIDEKKAEVDKLKGELRDLENELRAAGQPAGWARPANPQPAPPQ